MTVYEDLNLTYPDPRCYPWEIGKDNPSFRYYDLKNYPELIPQVLEDFLPFSNQPAIQKFYDFLTWINCPNSMLETDDCAFRPPTTHTDINSDKKLCCHGRVFIFFRDLRLNLHLEASSWLFDSFFIGLTNYDHELSSSEAVIAITKQKTLYTPLLQQHNYNEILGATLMLSFWAYGNTEDEVFKNLLRLFENLDTVAKANSNHIQTHRQLFENALAKKYENT